MKPLIVFVLVIFIAVPRSISASRAEILVETLKKTAKPGNGITEVEQKIAKEVKAAGPAAIPYLLRLLHDKNEDVRDLASFTLRDIKGLTEEHLDALIESRRRGDGWISPAIARIGSPRAVEFLVEELLRERQTDTQLTCAVGILGEKAVPDLVKVYQHSEGWDDELERTMSSVFNDLGKRAIGAIDPLLTIANDETAPSNKRVRAMAAIGKIGVAAERAVPELVKLQGHGSADVRAAAESAIVGIGTAEAVPILLERIRDRGFSVSQIASLGPRGRSAGPAVTKYLADDDWDVRLEAARTLGCIGYDEAAGELIKLLACMDDWRQVFCAAKSLQLLKAESALPALSQVSKEHWYPPVRAVAAEAIKTIRSGIVPKIEDMASNPSSDFFDYEHAGRKMDSFDFNKAKPLRFPLAAHQYELVKVTFQKPGKAAKEEQWVGVKVADGYVAGSDRGEFGGEVGFIDRTGKAEVIAQMNTEAIYQTEHGIFAVTGLAHMSMNNGLIYKLGKNADGAWTAEKWRALPGAPVFSRLLKDGRIFVSCYGGIVLVSPDGSMKSLTRREALKGPVSRR